MDNQDREQGLRTRMKNQDREQGKRTKIDKNVIRQSNESPKAIKKYLRTFSNNKTCSAGILVLNILNI